MLKHYDRERTIWESSLKPNEKIILLALNSFVDANGKCWPGQELLSRMTSLSDRTIRKVCNSLETRKIIQRSRRFDKEGHRTSDKYTVIFNNISTHGSCQSLPEESSGGSDPYRKKMSSLPEKNVNPYRKILPGIYPVRSIQKEKKKK